MKVKEVIGSCANVTEAQPTLVAKQSRVSNLANQIASSNANQPPTQAEKMLAFRQNVQRQRQIDANYAQQLKTQAANASQLLLPKNEFAKRK